MPVTPANREALIQNEDTMRYRPLGATGLQVSALSFGCMRLVEDQEVNTEVVSKAVEMGVNYFETTRFYCQGECQQRTAPGLKGKTAGVIVSGKGSLSADTTAYAFRQEMERQLDTLGLTHFKFYQVGWFAWERMPHLLKRGGALDALRQAREEGLVQHVGFTGHDKPENFIKCIETGIFDSLTIPYSLLNRAYEPTIKRAGELGVGVVAMCPVAGGMLSGESDKLQEALGIDMPTTAMALRFVLSNPDVSTACSGMSSLAMLDQNVRTVKEFDPAADNHFEQMCEGLDRMRESLGESFCTACGYCMPCPQNVNIPMYMELDRQWKVFGLANGVRDGIRALPAEQGPSVCTECGACEDKCPNALPIRETMKALEKMAAK